MKNVKRKPRPNLGQIAYEEIKSMILNGELEPGERLVLDSLSEKLNLSVTPIRDALNKLEQEDLIVITPRTSHSVVEINEKDAKDIVDLRLNLELFAIQSAGENLAQFPVKKYRSIFSDPTLKKNPKKFSKADTEFHNSILAISQNKRIPRLYSYLQNLIQVLSIHATKAEGRIDDASQEHLKIINAIEQKNIALISKLLTEHFNKMRIALIQIISNKRNHQ